MKIEFTKNAWEDYEYWTETNPELIDKIKELIQSIVENPFQGLGKPEPLKHNLKGFWSRRITQEHRLVYKVSGRKGVNQTCTIIQCRFHYDE
jgi:toxin YoeB